MSSVEGMGFESVWVRRDGVGDIVDTVVPALPDFRLQQDVEEEDGESLATLVSTYYTS